MIVAQWGQLDLEIRVFSAVPLEARGVLKRVLCCNVRSIVARASRAGKCCSRACNYIRRVVPLPHGRMSIRMSIRKIDSEKKYRAEGSASPAVVPPETLHRFARIREMRSRRLRKGRFLHSERNIPN
jgi:hypothetical protein